MASRISAPTRFRPLRGAVLAALAMAAVSGPAAVAEPSRGGQILLFAAASTAEAVDAVSALYTRRGGARARTVYAASSALARQIANGAPAEIFLSANRKWMDWLAARGRIVVASRRKLFTNRLVLVVPRGSSLKFRIRPGFPLARRLGGGRLALADPDHVPAGLYARQALVSLGVWDTVGRRAARTRDVRGALALVERGEAPAGIVYATDARISKKVRVAGVFPRTAHAPIAYTAALVKGRDSPAARAFHAFLVSRPALDVFASHGFLVE